MSSIKQKLKWLLVPILTCLLPFNSSVFAFTDVNPGDENYVSISYLKENNIIDGYEDNTFKPRQFINRAEALKMLILGSGLFLEEDMIETKESPFNDTALSEWYTKYLITAKKNGIISGYEDGSFKPSQNINLVESVKIFLSSYQDINYQYIETISFNDTSTDEWYSKYISFAASRDMLYIDSLNNIYPEQEMRRGYLAELIYKMIKSSEGYGFGKATFYGAAVQGNHTASGEIFDKDLLTAAHKTLPFGTIAEVTNMSNGKSVNVKINDRGPYGPGRVIDLSSAAFEKIAWLGTGIIDIQYKVISSP